MNGNVIEIKIIKVQTVTIIICEYILWMKHNILSVPNFIWFFYENNIILFNTNYHY